MRILLAEDDQAIAQAVCSLLGAQGYAADHVADGEAALNALSLQSYDILLLDLGLPGRDGLAVLQNLRHRQQDLPVLIITARDTVDDRIAGLDAGTDDYIVKPFDLQELLARIRAVLRRRSGRADALISNGILTLNPANREAERDGKIQRLPAREYALLETLMLRAGTIFSRSDLEEKLYGWNEEVESNAVELLIHQLRKKLGSDVIKNVRGIGWFVEKG